MQKTHKLRTAGTALILVLLLIILSMPASASARTAMPRTYRVGANEMFGVNKTDSGYSGISFDYLNALSRYTGDNYIFVEGSEAELFFKLKNGQIDLIPCVTEYDREYYESVFSGESDIEMFRKTGNALISRFGAVYVYDKGGYRDTVMNDVSVIRHMKIGYLESDKARYFEDGRCIYSDIEGADFVSYLKEETMRGDFVSGKIDAVIKDCLRPWSDETIVYQFEARSGFFVTRANDSELAHRLEKGLISLFMDSPTFYGSVYERYITNYGSRKFAYNTVESEYKKNHGEITVAFNLEDDTMRSYDEKSGTLSGVTGLLVKKYSEATGLNVVIKPCGSLAEGLGMLDSRDVDMVYGGIRSSDSLGRDIYVSSPAINFPLVLMSRNSGDISDTMKIAVNTGNDEAIASLEHFYPDAGIVLAENLEEACEMAESGRTNAVCLTGYDAMYFKNNGFSKLEMSKVLPVYSTECFAIRSEDRGLSGITENALVRINSSEAIANIYNMFEAGDRSSANGGMYAWLIVAAFVTFMLLIVGMIAVIIMKENRTHDIDPLTGGYSRKTFIEKALHTIKKSGTSKWQLIVIDIDKFKFINDRLGYEEGDRMLERVYKTLGDHMESGESYARISDDNFACCIREQSDEDVIERMESIFEEFKRRNSLFVSYPVLFSAGVCSLAECVSEDGAVDMNMAIDHCKIAKKTIKGLHSSAVAFYDGRLRDKTLREKDFENAMPKALEKHEFMCYIQPKYGAKSRLIEGGEALIRWRSSEFGFVFPGEFIPISEKNGFVVELDFFILEEVCKAMRRWMDMGLTPVTVSVNQSRMHLSHDDYIWRLREIVDKYAIPYEYIELELTETVFTENAELLLRIMQKLHDIGFKLSIDDFGSGYSSLNMLKDIPADVVKIDREFFNGTVHSDKGREVIMTVVDLAKRLKMHVISEGVETIDQVEFLDKINCDLIQGYFFAKPMPLSEFEALWFSELQKNGAAITADSGSAAPRK